MGTAPGRTYADAIDSLNTFQTPFAVLEARRRAGIRPVTVDLDDMRDCWAHLGHQPKDLDRLNVIHVAGTKGKGSVCAFVASILAQHQGAQAARRWPVGLLTSPHLVAVRERIRLDSQPLSEEEFARSFFEVRDALLVAAPGQASVTMPPYARFLTLMALHVFVRRRVAVAVVETGMGGEYDATNIVARPLATGITTLGLDHVAVLGPSVDHIAWHKAGIMKRGCAAFAVEQPAFPGTEAVLRQRAAEKGAVLLPFVGIDRRLAASGVRVRPDAEFQQRNVSLAIALAEKALETLRPGAVCRDGDRLPAEFKDGIEQVVLRGRCEVMEEDGGRIRWHIDGAHTADSLEVAAVWFVGETKGRRGPRVLIFNQQGRTEAVDFLDRLHHGSRRQDGSSFDHVIFCTNVTYASTGYKRDFVDHQSDPDAVQKLTMQRTFAEKWSSIEARANVTVIHSIEEAINTARHHKKSLGEEEAVQVLITGSLRLVGGALGILEGIDAL